MEPSKAARQRDRAPGPARTQSRQRKALFIVLLGLLVAAVVLANVVAQQLAGRLDLSFDLTADSAFEPGPETRALLQGLDRDVEIYVLASQDAFQGSVYLQQAQRMLAQYPRLAPRVKLTYVDYVLDPSFASRYPDLTLSEGSVLVVCGERTRLLQLSELFNYSQNEAGGMTVLSSRAEEAVTVAILYVISDEQTGVVLLTGNGMANMPALTDLLTANNYAVSQVNLTTAALDDRYDLALLLAPQIDLSEDALKKLDAFLYNGGAYGKTLVYTADVTQPELPNLEAFLREWGLAMRAGAVFETAAERTYQYQPYYPTAAYVDETYRDKLIDRNAPVLMPLSRPMELLFESRDRVYNELLLQFAETSGVRPASAVEGFKVEQAERWGPMPALVLSSKRIYGTSGLVEGRSNLVVSTSTAMLDAFSMQNTSLANSAYLLNLFGALCERHETVTIAPKSLAGARLAISTAQASTLGAVLAGALPLGILLAGVVVWLARRYQ
ncbi:MAG: Gldg family protein [Anaerolineae bacterium]|jgi:ABC-2 type transport system permease protein